MAGTSLDWLYSDSPFDQSKIQAGLASQQAGADGRTVLTGNALLSTANTIKAPTWVPGATYMQSMGDSGDVQTINDPGYFLSSNGTRLAAVDGAQFGDPGGQYFTDQYNNPTGNGSHDQASITYKVNADGSATPVNANNAYSPGDWTDTYRPAGEILGTVLTAGAVGAALAGGAAAGGAVGAGAGEAAAGAAAGGSGLSSAELAALYGDAGYGATGAAEAGAAAGATGGGLSSADLAALYSNAGYGTTGSAWDGVLAGAGKGALLNGGTTALRGGSLSDVLKSAAIGGASGGFASGVSAVNPAGYAGITNTTAANAFNGAVSSGSLAAVKGGNVGQAIGGSLFSAGTNAALNYAGNVGSTPASGGNGMSYNFDFGTPSSGYTGFTTDSPSDTVDSSWSPTASTGTYVPTYDTTGNPYNFTNTSGTSAFSSLGSLLTSAGKTLGTQTGAGFSYGQLLAAGLSAYGASQTTAMQQAALNGAQSASAAQYGLAQDQWNYEKNVYLPQQQARSDAAFQLTSAAAQQQMANSADDQNLADQSFNQAKKSWEFQDDYMGLARDYLSGKAGNTMANTANADVNQAYAGAQGTLNRNAQRMGLNPGSGAFVSNMYDLANQKALAGAGAQTAAYTAARDKAEQMVGIAAGSGTAGFGTGLSASGLSTGAANSAVGAANSGVTNGATTNNSLTSGLTSANAGLASANSGWNNLANTAVNTSNPLTSTLSGLFAGQSTSLASQP